jgi:hypothetical protein
MEFEFSIIFISIVGFKIFNHACAQIWSVNRPPTNKYFDNYLLTYSIEQGPSWEAS